MYEGEKILIVMAYTILKVHRKRMMNLRMDDCLEFLQSKLRQNFEFSDDEAIENLKRCMEELKRYGLDHPGPCPENETAQKPFGLVKTPSVERLIGRRKKDLSTAEQLTQEVLTKRYEKADMNSTSDYHSTNGKIIKGSMVSIGKTSF